jgi:hypothetical protein
MERHLLGLEISNNLFGALDSELIADRPFYLPKPLDHPLDFFALFTHVSPSMWAESCWLVEAATFGRSAIANHRARVRLLSFEGFRQHGA